ncbi:glutaredoxin family protein [Candidatus Saccharibacteria bacterium]|nr:glutaredoxin family protein [Candidatus Saccharibacteria bacterium]
MGIIMAKDITIFTTNTCSYCGMVKRFLDMKGLKYDVVNLDEHPERNQEAYELSNGALTVPITVITKEDDTKNVVVGYNIGQLAPAVA